MIRFKYDAPSEFNLHLLGDTHIGNIAFAEEKLKKVIQRIKRDKKGLVGLMGDMCEAIHVGDKRYSPDVHAGKFGRITEQAKHVANLLRPIKDQIVFCLDGNHENKLRDVLNVGELIRDYLDCPMKYGAFSMKVDFGAFKLFAVHGRGSVNSMAGDPKQIEVNDGIRIKRKLRHLAGDCMVMCLGHIHKMRVCEPTSGLHMVDGEDGDLKGVYPTIAHTPEGAIPEEYRWYGSTGSFLRTQMDGVTTYSEEGMYSPTELGYLKVIVGDGVRVEKVYA